MTNYQTIELPNHQISELPNDFMASIVWIYIRNDWRNFTKHLLKNLLIEEKKHKKLRPKKETLNSIISYSKSLDVIKTSKLGKVNYIKN